MNHKKDKLNKSYYYNFRVKLVCDKLICQKSTIENEIVQTIIITSV